MQIKTELLIKKIMFHRQRWHVMFRWKYCFLIFNFWKSCTQLSIVVVNFNINNFFTLQLFQILKTLGFDFTAKRVFPIIPAALTELHLHSSQALSSCAIMHLEKNSKTGRKWLYLITLKVKGVKKTPTTPPNPPRPSLKNGGKVMLAV